MEPEQAHRRWTTIVLGYVLSRMQIILHLSKLFLLHEAYHGILNKQCTLLAVLAAVKNKMINHKNKHASFYSYTKCTMRAREHRAASAPNSHSKGTGIDLQQSSTCPSSPSLPFFLGQINWYLLLLGWKVPYKAMDDEYWAAMGERQKHKPQHPTRQNPTTY